MKKKYIIHKIILRQNEFNFKIIRKYCNLSKRSEIKTISDSFIYRIIRDLKRKNYILIAKSKRVKRANNYEILSYSVNSQLLNKLINK